MVLLGKSNHFCSSWTKRNSSANVARTVFNLHNPRTCYCGERKIPPKLFVKPKARLTEDHNTLKPPDPERHSNAFHRFESSRYESSIDVTPSEADDASRHLLQHPTSSSEHVSDKTFDEEPPNKSLTVGKVDASPLAERLETSATFGEEPRKKSPTTNKDDTSRVVMAVAEQALLQKRTDLRGLEEFRRNHYFETHSVQDLVENVPEHGCVHRFRLDDRFLPEPLNGDVYGRSRCVICNRPMGNPQIAKRTDERTATEKKSCAFPLTPKKIYMTDGGDVFVRTAFKKFGKRPNYFNTYALKYQKGVVS